MIRVGFLWEVRGLEVSGVSLTKRHWHDLVSYGSCLLVVLRMDLKQSGLTNAIAARLFQCSSWHST